MNHILIDLESKLKQSQGNEITYSYILSSYDVENMKEGKQAILPPTDNDLDKRWDFVSRVKDMITIRKQDTIFEENYRISCLRYVIKPTDGDISNNKIELHVFVGNQSFSKQFEYDNKTFAIIAKTISYHFGIEVGKIYVHVSSLNV